MVSTIRGDSSEIVAGFGVAGMNITLVLWTRLYKCLESPFFSKVKSRVTLMYMATYSECLDGGLGPAHKWCVTSELYSRWRAGQHRLMSCWVVILTRMKLAIQKFCDMAD